MLRRNTAPPVEPEVPGPTLPAKGTTRVPPTSTGSVGANLHHHHQYESIDALKALHPDTPAGSVDSGVSEADIGSMVLVEGLVGLFTLAFIGPAEAWPNSRLCYLRMAGDSPLQMLEGLVVQPSRVTLANSTRQNSTDSATVSLRRATAVRARPLPPPPEPVGLVVASSNPYEVPVSATDTEPDAKSPSRANTVFHRPPPVPPRPSLQDDPAVVELYS